MNERRGAESAEFAEDENQISELVIGAAIEVHRRLGPGLLEGAYEACLCHELTLRRVRFEVEAFSEVHQVQLLTYLRLANKRLGLVINFNTPVLWRGVRRVVNKL